MGGKAKKKSALGVGGREGGPAASNFNAESFTAKVEAGKAVEQLRRGRKRNKELLTFTAVFVLSGSLAFGPAQKPPSACWQRDL